MDTGTVFTPQLVLQALKPHSVSAIALTHGHLDHQGGAHAICTALDIPLWCGEKDRKAVESGELSGLLPAPHGLLATVSQPLAGPAHPVSRILREGDEIADFTVIATPGHTRGHLSFWRPSDRTLVLGDVLFHRSPVTLRFGLREPYAMITYDEGENRRSIHKIAELGPALVCFGHGEPLADSNQISDFAALV